jgi:hypothetical protein
MFQEGLTNQFLADILKGVHRPGDTYKIALYTKAAATDKNASLTAYNTTGELPTAGGYTRGGQVLSGFAVGVSGRTAYIDWTDAVWPNATFSADAAIIYNASRANAALAIIDFVGMITSSSGPFTVEFPAAGPTAVIRITGN